MSEEGLRPGLLEAFGPKFTIVRQVGRVGDGLIYEARDGIRPVRLREYAPPHVTVRDADGLPRAANAMAELPWRSGARAFVGLGERLAQARHPGIVEAELATSVTVGGSECAVLVTTPAGESLQAALDGGLYISRDDVLDIAHQLATLLADLHATGIVHGDVRPETLHLASGRVRLTDFAVDNRAFMPLAQTHEGFVTPGYSPLERYDASGHEPLSPQTDIYGAAATLYRLVAGRVPPTWQDRWNQADPLSFPIGCPYEAAFLEWLRAGLALEASDRPADGGAWLSALSGAAAAAAAAYQPTFDAAAPGSTRDDAEPAATYPERRRIPVFVHVALAMLVLLIGGVLLTTYLANRPSAAQGGAGVTAYVVTGTAKVRPQPSADSGPVAGTLHAGGRIRGEKVTGPSGADWVRISEGMLAGKYVWIGNLSGAGLPAPVEDPQAGNVQAAAPEQQASVALQADFHRTGAADAHLGPNSIVRSASLKVASWPITIRGVQFRPTFRETPQDEGTEIEGTLAITQPVTWNGLKVRSLSAYTAFEAGGAGVHFDEPVARVRSRLRELGAMVPPASGDLTIPAGEIQGAMSLAAEGGGTSLQCGSWE